MDKTRLGLSAKFRALAGGIPICAILLFAHSPVLAAASTLQVVQAANHEVTTGATSTVAITIAAGDLAVVWCSESINNTSAASISDSSGGKNVWTQTSSGYVSVSPTARGAMFYSSLAAQLTSVTCTWSGGINGRVQTVVYDISGAASSGIEDSSVNSTNTNSVTDLLSNASGKTLTTTNANDILLFGIRVTANQTSFAAGSNHAIQSGASGIRSTMSYRIVSSTQSAVSTDISYSVAANNGQGVYAAFKAATGTGGTGPSITGLNPSSGPVGATVIIAGSNFGASQGASTVTFNGAVATPTSWSAASIAVPVPNGATTGNVIVNVGGVASNPVAFTVIVPPSITSLSPTFAPLGASVTISGSNFGASQGTSTVTFNGVAATPTSWSTTSITAPVPSGATSGNVVVTVGGLASNGVPFTVTVPPNITSLNPTSGPIGTSVTIVGTNFGASRGTSTVTFNGISAGSTSWSNTSITAVVPDGASSGNVVVTVGGVSSNGVAFMVTPPAINLPSPSSGGFQTPVTINGTGFGFLQGSSTVSFGGTLATPTSWNMTSITVPVPKGAASGNVVVTVGGLPSNGVNFTVLPISVSVSPASVTLNTNSSVGYTATLQGDTANLGVMWSLTGAGCSGSACGALAFPTSNTTTSYTAPPTMPNPPTVTVTATSLSDPSKSASSTVTITQSVPSITSLNPSSGPESTRVTIAGSNFGPSPGASTVTFNGTPGIISSANWTPTSIVAFVPRATSGNVVVTVGGFASNGLPFTVTVPPNIYVVSPDNGPIATSVIIVGSSFGASQGTSTITFNGTAATPTNWSDTSIVAPVPSGATTGNIVVTVAGLTASGGLFTVTPPPPAITSLSPVGGLAGTSVTITGYGFGASQGNSTVTFNATLGIPTSWSDTSIVVPVPSGATTGNVVVTVGGIATNGVNFTVAPPPPPPSITTLSPSSAVAGGGPLTITVDGTNFVPSSTVQWNGSVLATTFLSNTQLQATVTYTSLASLGAAKVTVSSASVGGGVSNASTFFVGTTGGSNFAAIVLNQAAQDIVYDPKNQVFYLSVPATSSTYANTIAVLDPTTAAVTSVQSTGINPHVLAISDDSQFLYAGIDGTSTVQRFILPGLTPDISYPLGSDPYSGPYLALDLQVAPGAPHTSAVTLGVSSGSPRALGGITIFDDSTPRPTKTPGFGGTGLLFDSLQWGADSNTLFASNTETTGFDFYVLAVNSSGVTLNQDFQSTFTTFGANIHFDPVTNLVYSDDGHVINPASGLPVGNFNATRAVAADGALNTAFFVGLNSNSVATTKSFDLAHFTPISTATIPNVTGTPLHLVRWGQNGLAFINKNLSGTSQVVLLGGDFISAAPPFVSTPPPPPVLPTAPAPNAPAITALNPSSRTVGSGSFVLNVTGTHFDPAAIVQFNGGALSTTFVSSTQLQALVPAISIANPGSASVVVANPPTGGGNSGSATFFVGSNGGISSTGTGFAFQIVSQVSNRIAFDPASQRFYLSVPNSVATGNSIAVLDPTTATIVGQQFAGSNPNALTISDDSQFLYAGIDGSSSVQRFTLPGLGTDMNYSLGAGPNYYIGPYFALDLQVAPGSPHTTAVTRGAWNSSPAALGGIEIFDDATARPTIAKGFGPGGGGGVTYDSIQWGSDATTIFAAENEGSGFDFYSLSVTPNGVSLTSDFPYTFSSFHNTIHFDRGTNLVYSDDGHVVVPSTGASAGTFPITGLMSPIMVPDSSLNLAFFTSKTGSSSIGIYSFNLSTFAPVSSITIPNVQGNPVRLIRWGQNGLAFNTDAGQIVLVGGNFVH